MKNTGFIVKTDGEKALIKVHRSSACGENCAACKGCKGNQLELWAENTVSAKEGDQVVFETATSEILKTAFLIYIAPILAGIFTYLLLSEFSVKEGIKIFSMIIVLLLFCVFLGRLDKVLKKSSKLKAIITKIL